MAILSYSFKSQVNTREDKDIVSQICALSAQWPTFKKGIRSGATDCGGNALSLEHKVKRVWMRFAN